MKRKAEAAGKSPARLKPARPERMDRWLKRRFPSLTGRQLEEALAGGLVLNEQGKRPKKGDRLPGEPHLDVRKLEAHLAELRCGDAELRAEVVHQAADFVVIDKPAGMPSHPLSLFDRHTVTHWAFSRFPVVRDAFPGIQPTITPHRLDTGTSGLLVVALVPDAYERWRERFRRKQVRKQYLAWCWGAPESDRFEADWPIGHDPRDRRRMVPVRSGTRFLKPLLPAFTRFEILRRDSNSGLFLTRVECETGVTHQVRVHAASLGFPLVGDALYDPLATDRTLRPAHHQLRAISLSCSEVSIALDSTPFAEKVPEA